MEPGNRTERKIHLRTIFSGVRSSSRPRPPSNMPVTTRFGTVKLFFSCRFDGKGTQKRKSVDKSFEEWKKKGVDKNVNQEHTAWQQKHSEDRIAVYRGTSSLQTIRKGKRTKKILQKHKIEKIKNGKSRPRIEPLPHS